MNKNLKMMIGAVATGVVTTLGMNGLGLVKSGAVTCPPGSVNPSADSYAGCNVQKDAAGNGLMPRVNMIINVILGVLGLVAVIMIILGGVYFVTSSGDAAKVKKAKDTILYGVIGLVIALLAFAIVNFVLGNVFSAAPAA